MKKLVLIALVLSTMGCSIMNYEKPKYTIGMSEEDFVYLNNSEQKVLADEKVSIYRTPNGMQSPYAFFIFDKGKLIRYEEGSLSDDFKFINLRNL